MRVPRHGWWRVTCAVLGGAVCLSLATAHPDIERQVADVTLRIQADPGNAELYVQRGELHRIHEEWSAAEADYHRARQLRRDFVEVDFFLGRLRLEAGEPKPAKRLLDRFLARRPEHPAALVARARALVLLEQPLAAARDFTRAIELHGADARPDPAYYLERARALAGAGRLDEALAGLDDGLAQLGRPVTLELYALELELGRGRYDAALVRLDRLSAGAARQETWLVRRGEILEAAGRPDEARRAYAEALSAITRLPASRRGSRAVLRLQGQAEGALARLGQPGG